MATLFEYQSWSELTQPARWDKALRPAMTELESRLPGMFGAGDIWLHRNVSWTDLERVGKPGARPPEEPCWPLMYLVCHYRKALFGFRLTIHKYRDHERREPWKVRDEFVYGIPCFRYNIDADLPASDLEALMKDLCEEARKARKQQRPVWQCIGTPVRFNKDGGCLIERGLVREDAGDWLPTECGEDAGLITLFTPRRDGTAERTLRWSPSTQKALTGIQAAGPIPLHLRLDRVKRGLACRDANAMKAVLELAELPLEEYFRAYPEVNEYDIQKLRVSLGLQKGCTFRTAAAALYRRVEQAESEWEQERLVPLTVMFTMPIIRLDKNEENKGLVMRMMKKFREGEFLS